MKWLWQFARLNHAGEEGVERRPSNDVIEFTRGRTSKRWCVRYEIRIGVDVVGLISARASGGRIFPC